MTGGVDDCSLKQGMAVSLTSRIPMLLCYQLSLLAGSLGMRPAAHMVTECSVVTILIPVPGIIAWEWRP